MQRLIDSGLTLELVNYDGSSLTNSEWEAFQAGEGDAVYAKGVHSGEAVKSGLFDDVDYGGIYYLTSDEIDALLSGDTDQYGLREEGRTPQEDLFLPLADSPRPQVPGLPTGWADLNNPPTSVQPGGQPERITPPINVDADLIYSAWNTTPADPGYIPQADLNADGVINSLDLGLLNEQDNQVASAEGKSPALPVRRRRL